MEKVKAMMAERGFRSFLPPSYKSEVKGNWYKIVEGEPCRSNAKLQVLVELYHLKDMDPRSVPSLEINISGEDDKGIWWKLKAYSLRERDLMLLDDVISRLIEAWNSLHAPDLVRLARGGGKAASYE